MDLRLACDGVIGQQISRAALCALLAKKKLVSNRSLDVVDIGDGGHLRYRQDKNTFA